MSFLELREQIYNLKQTDLEMMTIKLDQKAKRIGFFKLSAEDRFFIDSRNKISSRNFY